MAKDKYDIIAWEDVAGEVGGPGGKDKRIKILKKIYNENKVVTSVNAKGGEYFVVEA